VWVIANVVQIGKEEFIGHCYKNRVYREHDKVQADLKQVQHGTSNYKVFKVLLQEDGKDE